MLFIFFQRFSEFSLLEEFNFVKMIEIDLPRMRSLSPHIDSPTPMSTLPAMTQLNLTNITEVEQPTLNTPPLNPTKTCEWKYESDFCGCKSVCGCKYINKVSLNLYVLISYNNNIILKLVLYYYKEEEEEKNDSNCLLLLLATCRPQGII